MLIPVMFRVMCKVCGKPSGDNIMCMNCYREMKRQEQSTAFQKTLDSPEYNDIKKQVVRLGELIDKLEGDIKNENDTSL